MKSPIKFPRLLTLLIVFMALFLFVGTSTTLAAPAEAPAQQTNGFYYTIQWGDTLSQIAVRNGTTMNAIMMANPQIVNPNLLYAGTVLFIPTSPPQPVQPIAPPSGGQAGNCRYYHTVLPGQYMIQISNQYGVSPFVIAEANQIFNLNRIFAGQVLCIP